MKKLLCLLVIGYMSGSLYATDTVIKGDTMEVQDRGEKVIFLGHVILDKGADRIWADRMETNKGRDKVFANGNVKLLRHMSSTETINAFGREGMYDTHSGAGFILGQKEQSHVIYSQVLSSTLTRTVDILADRFDFSRATATGTATGNVYGTTFDPETKDLYKFWSDIAVYDNVEKTIHLTGKVQPHTEQQNTGIERHMHGNEITYFYESKKFISKGDAMAVIIKTSTSTAKAKK
jgi:lipopolysaccharide export system protein LptA